MSLLSPDRGQSQRFARPDRRPCPGMGIWQGSPLDSTEHRIVSYKYFIVSPNSMRLSRLSGEINEEALAVLRIGKYIMESSREAWITARERGRACEIVLNMICHDNEPPCCFRKPMQRRYRLLQVSDFQVVIWLSELEIYNVRRLQEGKEA